MNNKSISTSSEPEPKWAWRPLGNSRDTPVGTPSEKDGLVDGDCRMFIGTMPRAGLDGALNFLRQ